MNLRADPVQRKRHQTHATLRVEAPDRLHQADVALLNQVGLRQAIAEIIPAHGDDEPQVRQHELACGIEVVIALEPSAERGFLFGSQQRKAIHRLDVMVQAP